MVRLGNNVYLARPNVPSTYSLYAASRLLDVKTDTLRKMVSQGKLRARKSSHRGHWMIPRSEVVRVAKDLFGDRPLKIARIMAAPKCRPIVLSNDIRVRNALSSHNPVYCASPYALGQYLCIRSCNTVVVDWETCGSHWARDIATRIGQLHDRPRIVGILPECVEESSFGWDRLLPRPFRSSELSSSVK